jgi:hypothetical protein
MYSNFFLDTIYETKHDETLSTHRAPSRSLTRGLWCPSYSSRLRAPSWRLTRP